MTSDYTDSNDSFDRTNARTIVSSPLTQTSQSRETNNAPIVTIKLKPNQQDSLFPHHAIESTESTNIEAKNVRSEKSRKRKRSAKNVKKLNVKSRVFLSSNKQSLPAEPKSNQSNSMNSMGNMGMKIALHKVKSEKSADLRTSRSAKSVSRPRSRPSGQFEEDLKTKIQQSVPQSARPVSRTSLQKPQLSKSVAKTLTSKQKNIQKSQISPSISKQSTSKNTTPRKLNTTSSKYTTPSSNNLSPKLNEAQPNNTSKEAIIVATGSKDNSEFIIESLREEIEMMKQELTSKDEALHSLKEQILHIQSSYSRQEQQTKLLRDENNKLFNNFQILRRYHEDLLMSNKTTFSEINNIILFQ